jgi:methyl-accepting chemotaxis protein
MATIIEDRPKASADSEALSEISQPNRTAARDENRSAEIRGKKSKHNEKTTYDNPGKRNKAEQAAEAALKAKDEGGRLKLADYARHVPVATAGSLCKDLLDLFQHHPQCECIVLENENGGIAGLAMRHRFSYKLAHRYSVALFYNKPAFGLVDQNPIMVSLDANPSELIQLAMSREGDSLYDCIVLTDGGRYAGVLTVGDLLGMLTVLQKEAEKSRSEAVQSASALIQGIADAVSKVQESSAAGEGLSSQMVELTLQGKEELTQVQQAFRRLEQNALLQEERMKELQRQTDSIQTVSQLIKELAEQCNLLSINASIEAARAGEFGRGFGVVAGEFMKLAEQTKKSAVQITGMTNSIVQSIEAAGLQVEEGRRQTASSSFHVEAANEVYHRIFKAAAANRASVGAIGEQAGQAHKQALQVAGEISLLHQGK